MCVFLVLFLHMSYFFTFLCLFCSVYLAGSFCHCHHFSQSRPLWSEAALFLELFEVSAVSHAFSLPPGRGEPNARPPRLGWDSTGVLGQNVPVSGPVFKGNQLERPSFVLVPPIAPCFP